MSDTRRGQRDANRATREEVFARDGWRCRLLAVDGHRCYGPLTFHHRRKAGQGGGYTLTNGAAVCATGNSALEADADLARAARAIGLVVRRGDPDWHACG